MELRQYEAGPKFGKKYKVSLTYAIDTHSEFYVTFEYLFFVHFD